MNFKKKVKDFQESQESGERELRSGSDRHWTKRRRAQRGVRNHGAAFDGTSQDTMGPEVRSIKLTRKEQTSLPAGVSKGKV